MYSNLSCYDIYKTRPQEFFGRYSVSRSSTFCWYLLGFLPVSCPYSVRILSVLSRVFTGTSTSLHCASGFVHPKVIPLIVSSHLLDVPFIVSWMNVISCDRTCRGSYDTIINSIRDVENFLSVFYRFYCRCFVGFLSIVRLLSVDVCLVFCRYSARILSVLCP